MAVSFVEKRLGFPGDIISSLRLVVHAAEINRDYQARQSLFVQRHCAGNGSQVIDPLRPSPGCHERLCRDGVLRPTSVWLLRRHEQQALRGFTGAYAPEGGFMTLLDKRGKQTQTLPLDEVKRELGLRERGQYLLGWPPPRGLIGKSIENGRLQRPRLTLGELHHRWRSESPRKDDPAP